MGAFLAWRFVRMLLVMLGVSTVVFGTLRLSGDPAIQQSAYSLVRPEDIAAYRALLGLDQPWYAQYVQFLANLLRGELGRSFFFHTPVLPIVLTAFPATIVLAITSMTIAIVFGVGLGVTAASRRNSGYDLASMILAVLGQSIPVFFLGLLLMLVFSVWLRWLPAIGGGTVEHLVLPALTLSSALVASIARLVRSTMLDVLGEDYVRTARAKGLQERAVVYRHALRSAAVPVVTLVGLQFGYLLSGVVVVETVFGWPGMGQLAVRAIGTLDYPVVQATVLVTAACFVVVNYAVDVLHAFLDPRIKLA